jgi:tetratricopeptide (TPR) repeat protein
MSAVRIALAIVLAAAAVCAALLAGDVRSVRDALRNGDVVYAATPSRASWTAGTTFGGAAASLLGDQDDIDFRDALQHYVNASKLQLRLDNAVDVEGARGRAQDILEQASRTADPERASQALTLLGILAYRSAASGTSQSQVDAAIADFTDATRADPSNADAAFDLELLLRLTTAHGSRVQPGQGGGFGRVGRRGAGGGQPGSGY